MADWGYARQWRPGFADCDLATETSLGTPLNWLFFLDEAGVAAPVIAALTAAGHTVTTVRSGDSFQRRSTAEYILSPEQGRDGYEALMNALASDARLPQRIAHFWGVTGDEIFRPGSSFFDRNLEHGLLSLTHLAQGMGAVQMPGTCHLSVVTSGAMQVSDEGLAYPEKACALGPVGVIPREFPGVTARLLDVERPVVTNRHLRRAGAAQNDQRSRQILRDLLAEPSNGIAALRGDQRFEQVLRAAPLAAAPDTQVYTVGGIYLITGGFGGIGLSVARDIARRTQGHIVLLSRSALPPRAQWARHSGGGPTARRIVAIREIEALGGTVTCLTADVTDLAQMQRAAVTIKGLGPLAGIIHAAGVIDDAPILAKDTSSMQAVLAPKIAGLRVLDTVFADGAADLMVLFSSTSTLTTPAGQVDYVAANAYLDAIAQSRSRGKMRIITVNWGVWTETGMAAEAIARRMGGAAAPRALDLPLLRSVAEEVGGREVFQIALSADDDWMLAGHRTRAGQILLPGTAVIELAAEAMAAEGAFQPLELRDLYFLRPFTAESGTMQEGALHLTGDRAQRALTLHRTVDLEGRQGSIITAEAQLSPLIEPAPRIDPAAIDLRCAAQFGSDQNGGAFVSPQEAHLDFGPRWRVVTRTAISSTEGIAHLALPTAFRADISEGYLAHPALLDLATGWAIDLHGGYNPADLWVPAGYSALRLYRPLPAEIVSWVRLAEGGDADTAVFDVTVATPEGEVVLIANGLRMHRLAASALAAIGSAPAPKDVVFDAASVVQPLSAVEARLMRQIAQGITAEEGPEALHRVLASALAGKQPGGGVRIAISPLDLHGLIAEAAAPALQAGAGTPSFERPQLDGDYVAPKEGLEASLAEIWSSLLGIDAVGTEDSFFDLGGHSLLAVRLFAQVRQRHGVDFPLAVLFEAPTIAALAERIAALGGNAQAPCFTSAAPPAPAQGARQHLVALHPDVLGARRPLFIVAGMFGNVLNLRQLALLTGRARPVWGLQARGLIGDAAPHTSMEEAATDYIADMRAVQPEGPYYLAGFSGGGIAAFEIARQLRAAGQEVAMLALLDTPLPQRPALSRADKVLIKIHELRRKGVRYMGEWTRARVAWEMAKHRDSPEPSDDDGSFNNIKIEHAFRQAVAAYRPRQWDGPITLLRPKLDRHWKVTGGAWVSVAREYVLPDNGWARYCSHLTTIEVPGDHDGMVLVPNVAVLAGHLNAIAAAADTQVDLGEPPAWINQTAAE